MQKVVLGQETLVNALPSPLGKLDQEEPFQESTLPLPTAIQKLVVGQETLTSTFPGAMLVGPDQEEPFQESASPLSSTAMQKVVLGQETLKT